MMAAHHPDGRDEVSAVEAVDLLAAVSEVLVIGGRRVDAHDGLLPLMGRLGVRGALLFEREGSGFVTQAAVTAPGDGDGAAPASSRGPISRSTSEQDDESPPKSVPGLDLSRSSDPTPAEPGLGRFLKAVVDDGAVVVAPAGEPHLPGVAGFDDDAMTIAVPIDGRAGAAVLVLRREPGRRHPSAAELAVLHHIGRLFGKSGLSGRNAPSAATAPARPTPVDDDVLVGLDEMVGRTPVMRRLFDQIRQVAKWNTTALIVGESGTGKELIANAIHFNSPRARGPFIKLNCAALPDNLLESELFGYEKGAFTGATSAHPGRFSLAHRGTLFLDEIGEISPSFQAKLLRVLQEGEFERLGATQTTRVDVRVVAATNRDLEQEVAEKRFRRDLFYRLNVMPLRSPPLRERRDDIGTLAEHLVARLATNQGRPLSIDEDAIEALKTHEWPGNVRELENCVERAAIFSGDGHIDAGAVAAAGISGAPTSVPPPSSLDLGDPGLDERERVLAALEQAGWVQAKAARLLGMSPRQVAYRIQTLKIDVKRF